jgi:hypothetical protein
MSDEARLEEEMRRAEQAAALLTHPLMAEAFDTLDNELRTAWLESPARDVEGRETLWLSVKLLGQVKQHLQSLVETGKLATLDLSRRGLSAPR